MIYGAQYDCIYSAQGTGTNEDGEKIELSVPLGHYACFGDIYRGLRRVETSEVTYKVLLYKDNLDDKNYNLCTKAETKKILRCLQKVVPFTYKFSEMKYRKSGYNDTLVDFIVLTVHIEGNYTQHVWATSMLRCFFEWPYNVAAKESCELQSGIKQVDGFDCSKENWINLYFTIVAILGSTDLHGIVSLDKHPKAKSYHEWREHLASIHGHNRVIETIAKKGSTFKKGTPRIRIYSDEDYNQGVESRASKYVAAYKDKLSWKK